MYGSTGVLDGSPSFKFIDNQILGPTGSMAAPAFSFVEDIDTGIYLSNSDSIGIAIGGVKGVDITTNGVFQSNDLSENTYGIERVDSGTGSNLVILAGGAATGSTDLNGGSLILRSGVSTGTGTSDIRFQTYGNNDSSGVSDATLITRKIISGPHNIALATGENQFTDILRFDLSTPGYFTCAGEVFVYATDGTRYSSGSSRGNACCASNGTNFTREQSQRQDYSNTNPEDLILDRVRLEIRPPDGPGVKTLVVRTRVQTVVPNVYYFFIELSYTSSVEVTVLI